MLIANLCDIEDLNWLLTGEKTKTSKYSPEEKDLILDWQRNQTDTSNELDLDGLLFLRRIIAKENDLETLRYFSEDYLVKFWHFRAEASNLRKRVEELEQNLLKRIEKLEQNSAKS